MFESTLYTQTSSAALNALGNPVYPSVDSPEDCGTPVFLSVPQKHSGESTSEIAEDSCIWTTELSP